LGPRGEPSAARRVLYRLPWLLDWIADSSDRRPLVITQGEKGAESVVDAGGVATSCPGGAGKWHDDYAETLRGAFPDVVVVADQDRAPKAGAPPPGPARAVRVRARPARVGVSATIVRPPFGKDAADALAAGCSLDELY